MLIVFGAGAGGTGLLCVVGMRSNESPIDCEGGAAGLPTDDAAAVRIDEADLGENTDAKGEVAAF